MGATGKGLVEHWAWAAEKGIVNRNTAGGLRAACAQVLSVLDNWEEVDLRGLDVEDLLRRFQNLRKKEFSPGTLAVYAKRFRQALGSYLAYLENPSAWKAPAKRLRTKPRDADRETNETEPRDESGKVETTGGLVDYPFPLRRGVIVRLRLPLDLRREEARRITKFLETLTVDVDPTE